MYPFRVAMSSFHTILGIPQGASKEDIKRAYRRLSLIHHPDVPGGNNAKFIQIKEAYEQLVNPQPVHSQSYNADYFGNLFNCSFSVVQMKINGDGDVQIYMTLTNVRYIEGLLQLSKDYQWEMNGRSHGYIMIKKKDLVACNYLICLRFHGMNGNAVTKIYNVEDKRGFFEKLGDKVKRFF